MEPDKTSFKVSRACSDTYLTIATKRTVKELQNDLFPLTPRKTHSSNSFYYLDTNYGRRPLEDETPADRVTSWFLKYKETRDKEIDPDGLQQPRWPSECQVLDERIKHIPYKTCPPEPYYPPTGREIQPKPVGEEAGIIIYQYYPISSVDYFSRSSVGGSKYLLQTCPSPDEEGLRFESRFESGNLAKAIKIHETYYELYLRHDMYTNRHMQWFYFRVTGMKKGPIYRFSIVNFTKCENLYVDGMKPLIYSNKDAQMHSVGWRRVGNNIAYFCNENNNDDHPELPTFYTLTFTCDFPHEDDTVYFAHSYPYTYSDLQEYLFSIVAHPIKATYTTLRLLCKTLAGNNVYYVTVTTPPQECNPNKKKKAIVITARVHPGETPSSWIMQGLLEYLTSDCAPAKELRDNFIFKLVPMLNPDGVIVGNHRCSLTGRDLNRQYRTVIREYYPTIWYTKLMIRKLVEECGVAMYCDLHAHSKRNNIFIFGCENRKNPDRKLYEQVFPLMLHKNAPEKFSFQSCKFRVQKCKEGTGRVVMWMMGIANSFTMEASFAGSTLGSRTETHFNTMDFELMGKTFCQTLLDFYDEDPRKEKLRVKIMNRLMHEGSNADEPANINLSDYSSDEGDDSSSSVELRKDLVEAEVVPTAAPPPTPEKKKTAKPSKSQTVLQQQVAKPPLRKPIRIRKANLDLMNWKYDYSDDSSSSCSETFPKSKKVVKKKKKKKKARKISAERSTHNVATSEFKVNELLPEKTSTKATSKKPASMLQPIPHRFVGDNAYNPQMLKLIEIQNKLITLKNKLWFGVGDMDPQNPLSWGLKRDSKPEVVVKTTKLEKRKPSIKKPQKSKEEKVKDEPKQTKKSKEIVKRQPTIEQLGHQICNFKTLKQRKSPSFRVIKMNFDTNMPIELSHPTKANKNKKKKKPPKPSKLTVLPND